MEKLINEQDDILTFDYMDTQMIVTKVHYKKGVQYIETSKNDSFITCCFDSKYTGKVETEILVDNFFAGSKHTIVHLYGFMTLGKLQELTAKAQYEDGSSSKISLALSSIFQSYPNMILEWRKYGKFM